NSFDLLPDGHVLDDSGRKFPGSLGKDAAGHFIDDQTIQLRTRGSLWNVDLDAVFDQPSGNKRSAHRRRRSEQADALEIRGPDCRSRAVRDVQYRQAHRLTDGIEAAMSRVRADQHEIGAGLFELSCGAAIHLAMCRIVAS